MAELISQDFSLNGEVTFENAEAYKERGRSLIDAAEHEVRADLSGLAKSNSVTVAVMLSWMRHAALSGKTVIFVNLANDLRNIIEFSGLRELLLSAPSEVD